MVSDECALSARVSARYSTCLENVDSFLVSVVRMTASGAPPRLVLIDELLPPAKRAGVDVDWREAWAKSH